MSFIDKVENFARGSVARFTPLTELFPPVDLVNIRKNLGVENKGKYRGEKEFPPTDSTSPDDIELSIRSKFEDALQRYLGDYEGQLEAYRDRLQLISYAFSDFTTVSRFKDSIGDMKAEIDTAKGRLFNKRGHLKGMAGEISTFRTENALLNRMPIESNKVKNLFFLASISSLEIIFTFFLIREAGSPLTILFQSMIFIVLNIVISFYIGILGKWVHLAMDTLKKWIGLLAWVFWCGWAMVVNLLFSHYRSIATELSQNIERSSESQLAAYFQMHYRAVENFLASPFGLLDLWAWALFALGFFLALSAFIKGYRYNDIFPGYGDLKNRYDESRDDYLHSSEQARTLFKQERNKGSKLAETQLEMIAQDRRDVPKILNNAPALEGRFRNAFNRLNTDYETLVREYRVENSLARSSPAPLYFDSFDGLFEPELSKFEAIRPNDPEEIVNRLCEYRDQVHELFDLAISEVETMDNILQSEYPFKVERV